MATCGGTTARMVLASGTAGPVQIIVFAALGLKILLVRYSIRK